MDVLERTQKFPKTSRFTFTQQIENLVLDVLELLTGAQWATKTIKQDKLQETDKKLLRLHMLLQLCYKRQILDHKTWEHVARSLDETRRMLEK